MRLIKAHRKVFSLLSLFAMLFYAVEGHAGKLGANVWNSFAVKDDGEVYLWGMVSAGTGRVVNITTPSAQNVANAMSMQPDFFLKNNGTVWGWDLDNIYQIGNSQSLSSASSLSQLSGISNVSALSVGRSHILMLKSDGTLWGMGSNAYGRLMDDTLSTILVPTQIPGVSGIIAIAAGGDHSLALKSNGTVWAWGRNYYGELGTGDTTSQSATPLQVTGLENVVSIYAGTNFSIALKSDGTVWTWGTNRSGQLGDGSSVRYSRSPVQVSGLTDVVAINNKVALKSDGTVWRWGSNSGGQLGNGTTTDSSTPVQVSDLLNITDIGCSDTHCLALKNNGSVWAWGSNSGGQLGNGTTTNASTPVQVSNLNLGDSATAILAPTNFTATVDGSSVSLSWTAGTNASGYRVYYGTKDGSYLNTSSGLNLGNRTSYTINNLASGIYYLRLKSYDSLSNLSVFSNQVAVVIGSTTTSSTSPPTNVRSSVDSSSVTVSWTADNNASGYKVYYGTSTTNYLNASSGVDLGNTTSYTFSNVPAGTYYLALKSYDSSGNLSDYSSEVQATVISGTLSAPTNFTASVSGRLLTISWTADDAASGYGFYYGTNSGNYLNASNGANLGNRTSYSFNICCSGTFYLALKSYDSSGNLSDYSDEVTVTVR